MVIVGAGSVGEDFNEGLEGERSRRVVGLAIAMQVQTESDAEMEKVPGAAYLATEASTSTGRVHAAGKGTQSRPTVRGKAFGRILTSRADALAVGCRSIAYSKDSTRTSSIIH